MVDELRKLVTSNSAYRINWQPIICSELILLLLWLTVQFHIKQSLTVLTAVCTDVCLLICSWNNQIWQLIG